MAASAVVAQPDLLEREQVLEALRGALAAAATGHGRLVLVAGEAGIGKTAVVRAFCDGQVRPGHAVWGACDPLFTPRPLGPLLTIGEDMGGGLKDVLAGEAMPHEVVAALVRELRTHAPSVLVLEDVHWADEATLDVLRLLARRLEPIPAVVVATYRDAELHPKHPLRIMIGELATSRAVERVRLEPLSSRAVAQLAAPYGADPDELYRKTAGNPFFVVQALAAGGQEIPETVRDAVLARAARLSDEARRLLEAVATVPPRAELWLLTALVDDAVECLDDCLTSGLLDVDPNGIAFRHELGRLAVENSIAPTRRLELHRRALAALADPPNGSPDLALLAHHAEAAGDGDAVLRFAPEAAVRAATLGAHREAVAQYRRSLRFGGGLPMRERAQLLERSARSCFVTDQYDTGIAALEEALDLRRKLGDRLEEGDVLRRLSEFLWCPGRTTEATARAREAVSLLESLPPGPELGWAYSNLATRCASAAATADALAWGRRALELAERLGDEGLAVSALATIGVCEGSSLVEASLERARQAGNTDHVAWAHLLLGREAVEGRRNAEARRHLDAGLAYSREHGLELIILYLLAHRARLELNEGRWAEAVETATSVARVPRTSTKPRILALVVLGLIRARRGDPQAHTLLDEALALAEPTAELPRLEPVAAARAEAAWLRGDRDAVERAIGPALELARERDAPEFVGQIACWGHRAGLALGPLLPAAEPWSLELAGWPLEAAEWWDELGCPYDAAITLAQCDDEAPLRRAYDLLRELEAPAAAAIVARRLRERGVRGLPRGPRPGTRRNGAQLTARELEVLRLVADGLRNTEIAERLFLSPRTVEFHVAALLRKLESHTRGEAVAAAQRLGMLEDR